MSRWLGISGFFLVVIFRLERPWPASKANAFSATDAATAPAQTFQRGARI